MNMKIWHYIVGALYGVVAAIIIWVLCAVFGCTWHTTARGFEPYSVKEEVWQVPAEQRKTRDRTAEHAKYLRYLEAIERGDYDE